MIREYHVRFCEGLGVKSPRSTRRTARIKLVDLAVVFVITNGPLVPTLPWTAGWLNREISLTKFAIE